MPEIQVRGMFCVNRSLFTPHPIFLMFVPHIEKSPSPAGGEGADVVISLRHCNEMFRFCPKVAIFFLTGFKIIVIKTERENMKILPITQPINQNNSVQKNNNPNFGRHLEGFTQFIQESKLSIDHPLIALLKKLAGDGKEGIIKFDWGSYQGEDVVESGVTEVTSGLAPVVNLVPSLSKPLQKMQDFCTKILEKVNKSSRWNENPNYGLFNYNTGRVLERSSKFDEAYAYSKSDYEEDFKTLKERSASKIADWLVKTLDPETLDAKEATVIKTLEEDCATETARIERETQQTQQKALEAESKRVKEQQARIAQQKNDAERAGVLDELRNLGIG